MCAGKRTADAAIKARGDEARGDEIMPMTHIRPKLGEMNSIGMRIGVFEAWYYVDNTLLGVPRSIFLFLVG